MFLQVQQGTKNGPYGARSEAGKALAPLVSIYRSRLESQWVAVSSDFHTPEQTFAQEQQTTGWVRRVSHPQTPNPHPGAQVVRAWFLAGGPLARPVQVPLLKIGHRKGVRGPYAGF